MQQLKTRILFNLSESQKKTLEKNAEEFLWQTDGFSARLLSPFCAAATA